jgi:hypothetical protein
MKLPKSADVCCRMRSLSLGEEDGSAVISAGISAVGISAVSATLFTAEDTG